MAPTLSKVLLVGALAVTSCLARVNVYYDQTSFQAALGAATNYDYDIYQSAHGGHNTYTQAGNGYSGVISSLDVSTGLNDGDLAPVRDGYGTRRMPETLIQSAVSQTAELFYDFSSSPNPVYAFGGAIMLADSSAVIDDGLLKINVNHGRKVFTLPSQAYNSDGSERDISDQFFAFTTGFQIKNVRIIPVTSAPDDYVSITRAYIGTTPSVVSDPHFIGFQGERYEFQGEPNKWFSIISDSRIQVNALFDHLAYTNEGNTNMVAFGIVVEDHTILISANSTNAIVDGQSVRRVKEVTKDIKVTVVEDENYVEVDTPFYTFTIEHKETHEDQPFLNFFPLAKDFSRAPHGVLGQTMQHHHNQKVHIGNEEGKGEIEGTFKDYIVSSAFATDSVFNKYQ